VATYDLYSIELYRACAGATRDAAEERMDANFSLFFFFLFFFFFGKKLSQYLTVGSSRQTEPSRA